MKKKGQIETLQTPWGSMSATHVGPSMVLKWSRLYQALRYREIPRLFEMRKGIPESIAPELYPASINDLLVQTPEGMIEQEEIALAILRESSFRFRFDGQEFEGEEAVLEALRLCLLDVAAQFCMGVQTAEPVLSLVKGGHMGTDTALAVSAPV